MKPAMKPATKSPAPAIVVALTITLGALATAAPSWADTSVQPARTANSITVDVSFFGGDPIITLRGTPDMAGFDVAEELLIRAGYEDPSVRTLEFIIIDGPARLVAISSLCSPMADQPTGVACRVQNLGGSWPSVTVDFTGIGAVATTTAVETNSPIPLRFLGGPGPDYVQGGPVRDVIRGNGGDDDLFGGPGDDVIYGGPGADLIDGEGGRDSLYGGPGLDTLIAREVPGPQVPDFVDCGGEFKEIDFEPGVDVLSDCGADPQPLPPDPVEEPVAEGQATVEVDGETRSVETIVDSVGNRVTVVWPDANQRVQVPLTFGGTATISFEGSGFLPGQAVYVWMFSTPVFLGEVMVGPGVTTAQLRIPASVPAGPHTLQVRGRTGPGTQVTMNIGVEVAAPAASMVITGTRGTGKNRARVFLSGETTGLVGQRVTPRFQFRGQSGFETGLARPEVRANGTFSWQRKAGKTIRVFFEAGSLQSDRVTIAGR